MTQKPIDIIQKELYEGMSLAKCRKCGCMDEIHNHLQTFLPKLKTKEADHLLKSVNSWKKDMEEIKYSCLGCVYCFPAEVTNIINKEFPDSLNVQMNCGFEVREKKWFPVAGEYVEFCEGDSCPVAVSTLSSVGLAEEIAKNRPHELCIIGKTETENIGIDKIIKNTISNPTIRVLLIAGKESVGHNSGSTLLALWKNGVDENMRVIGSNGKRPILKNVSSDEVESFRKQVQVIDMIGNENAKSIETKIIEISKQFSSSCQCEQQNQIQLSKPPLVLAKETEKVELDKAGYFVIIPRDKENLISVEHYSYDNKLLRIIEGKNAKSILNTIIENKWVTQLSHASYLGSELSKAELSLKSGTKYVQEGA